MKNKSILAGLLYKIFALSLTLVFIGICFWLMFLILQADQKSQISQKWPAVTGKVIGSEKILSSGRRQSYYRAHIEYTYSIGGNTYQNKRIAFCWFNRGAISFKGRFCNAGHLLRTFRPGQDVLVYYNPLNPQESVLLPGAKTPQGIILFGFLILFSFLGILGVLSFFIPPAVTQKFVTGILLKFLPKNDNGI